MACVIRRCVWKYYACHRSVHGRRREEKTDQSFPDHRLVVCGKSRFGGRIGRNTAAKSLLKRNGGDTGVWKKLTEQHCAAIDVCYGRKCQLGEKGGYRGRPVECRLTAGKSGSGNGLCCSVYGGSKAGCRSFP